MLEVDSFGKLFNGKSIGTISIESLEDLFSLLFGEVKVEALDGVFPFS